MFEAILYEGTMVVAQIHESLMHLNDNFELYFGDKDMHFIVMAVLGMILFFMVHFVFKRLAKWSITAISFIYVFTVTVSYTHLRKWNERGGDCRGRTRHAHGAGAQ